jgi:GNAT superfamily N-acetyltransferase
VAAPELRAMDRPGDLGWVVERHGALYAEEHGWGVRFEALAAGIVGEFGAGHDPRLEAGWIAELDGVRAGCAFCTTSGREGVARLRMLLVEPFARGRGVGSLLLERCVAFARGAGYARMELWTTADLEAARRLYERAGFRVVREERESPFGIEVTSRYMELSLG